MHIIKYGTPESSPDLVCRSCRQSGPEREEQQWLAEK